MNKPVEISIGVVVRTIMIAIFLVFIYLVRDIITLLFISVLLVAMIEPIVNWLQSKKIPRGVGIILIYFALLIIIATCLYFIVPPLERQTADFIKNSPEYFGKIDDSLKKADVFFQRQNISFDSQQIVNNLNEEIANYSDNIFSRTVDIFTGVISVFIVLTLTFYMAVEEDGIKKSVVLVVPERHKEYAASLVERIKKKIVRWMHGQFFLMFIVFILDFIGLSLIGIPYALFLALFAGVLEIIPYAGPVISAVPGILIGFSISSFTGLLTILVYIFVQQFEGHVIVPQVMKKAVGLNPVVIILALLVGVKLGGIIGAIAAIPIATAVGLFLSDMFNRKEKI